MKEVLACFHLQRAGDTCMGHLHAEQSMITVLPLVAKTVSAA